MNTLASELASYAPAQKQHQLALAKANQVRVDRAALRRRLQGQPTRAHAARLCAELLSEPPNDAMRNMPVALLLVYCRRIGRANARLLLHAAQTSELRRVADLAPRQRESLIRGLRAMA
jgi:hypothetical protein